MIEYYSNYYANAMQNQRSTLSKGRIMTGVICKREVCTHPIVTIQSFGWKIFWHVLIASPNQTFLELVAKYSKLAPPQVNAFKVIGRCIKLEQRANRLYYYLALRLQHRKELSSFMYNLANQEQEHAELLDVCRKLADKKHWRYARFAQWKEALPRLEKAMGNLERQSEHLETDQEALQLVLSIEGSEINHLFSSVISTTDSPFIQSLSAFQKAEQNHIDYICEQITEMEPELSEECRKLKNGEPL